MVNLCLFIILCRIELIFRGVNGAMKQGLNSHRNSSVVHSAYTLGRLTSLASGSFDLSMIAKLVFVPNARFPEVSTPPVY